MNNKDGLKEVYIYTEYIKLQQFLKLAGVVSQGSDAKILIIEQQVKVNGEIEIKRGKKIRENDVVEINEFGKYIAICK